jgi:hypothetical protein
VLTRRAATENDHVVVAHRGSSVPAFAAMWAAGRSGQFLSSAVVLMAASWIV